MRSNQSSFDSIEIDHAQSGNIDEQATRSSQALHHYLVGQISFANDDYRGALLHFSKASELTTSPSPFLHQRLAQLQVKMGSMEEARKEAERALKEDPKNIDTQLLYAGILESLERSEEALPIYRKVISEQPERMDSYFLLSSALIRQKQYHEGIQVLNSFLAKDPNSAVAHYYLGRAYEIQNEGALARKELAHAFKLDSDNIPIAVEYLRILLKSQEGEKAKELCMHILEIDQKNLLARKILGHLLIGENDFDEALKHLQILEKEEEDATDTRFKIALIQLEKQRFEDAERELHLVLAQSPEHAQALYYLASIESASGRKKEAIDHLLGIGSDQELYVKSRALSALLLKQEGRLEEAERSIREALVAEPENKQLTVFFLSVLKENGKLEEARTLIQKELQRDPKDERLFFQYAEILNQLGHGAEAEQLMRRIIATNPSQSDALNFLAYAIAERKGDLSEARKFIDRALLIRANDAYYLDTRGWISYQESKFAEALRDFERALEIVGDDPTLVEHLGDAQFQLGEKEKAKISYQRVIELIKVDKKPDSETKETLKRVEEKVRR